MYVLHSGRLGTKGTQSLSVAAPCWLCSNPYGIRVIGLPLDQLQSLVIAIRPYPWCRDLLVVACLIHWISAWPSDHDVLAGRRGAVAGCVYTHPPSSSTSHHDHAVPEHLQRRLHKRITICNNCSIDHHGLASTMERQLGQWRNRFRIAGTTGHNRTTETTGPRTAMGAAERLPNH